MRNRSGTGHFRPWGRGVPGGACSEALLQLSTRPRRRTRCSFKRVGGSGGPFFRMDSHLRPLGAKSKRRRALFTTSHHGEGASSVRSEAHTTTSHPFTVSLHRTALHRTAPHAPHRTAPHRTSPHRTAPHRTAPHRTAPHHTTPHYTTPHHITLHRTTPYHTRSGRRGYRLQGHVAL